MTALGRLSKYPKFFFLVLFPFLCVFRCSININNFGSFWNRVVLMFGFNVNTFTYFLGWFFFYYYFLEALRSFVCRIVYVYASMRDDRCSFFVFFFLNWMDCVCVFFLSIVRAFFSLQLAQPNMSLCVWCLTYAHHLTQKQKQAKYGYFYPRAARVHVKNAKNYCIQQQKYKKYK